MRLQIEKWLPLAAVLAALAFGPGAWAQETTAGIQGTVKDASGGSVAKATIEVSGPALIGTRKAQTDESGNYRITALPPGVYTMTVAASGFRTSKLEGIDLSVGRLPNIDVDLQVGAVAETVQVSETTTLIDT